MASPNFDTLHLRFSRLIEDQVASATTDGDAITSAMRSDLLNQGIRRCMIRWVAQGQFDALRDYVNTESQSLVASAKALSGWTGGVFAILGVRNTTDSDAIVLPISPELAIEAQYGVNKYLLATSTATTVVSDATFTATGTTITNFTGVLSSHVGGLFVGLDNGGNAFVRRIETYVSSTSFTISSALVADGAGTNSYIVPPATTSNQKYYLLGGNFNLLGGTATSAIQLTYVKQHTDLVAGGSAGTVVSDTTWTATSTTITNFTGVLTTHVNGQFVGLDNGGNPFVRTITGYVSSSSFTIDSALVASGAGTNGYIVPLSSNDIAVPSQYWNEVLDEAAATYYEQYPSQENTVKLGILRGKTGR